MHRLIFIFSIFIVTEGYASAILLHTNDAVVWQHEQTITGELTGFTAGKAIVHHNQISFPVNVTNDQRFAFEVTLRDLKNKIWVEVPGEPAVVSDTLHYSLGYQPTPIVKPVATVNGNRAILQA